MVNKIEEIVNQNTEYKAIINAINNSPYIEMKRLFSQLSKEIDASFLENAINFLVSEKIIVELTSQAGSTTESRVPKKVFLINPEISEHIGNILE